MSMEIIKIQDVSKAFRNYPKRWNRLVEWLLPLSRKRRYTEHFVLRNINLNVLPGEAIAFVGLNGAGKSTLLKLIAGTLIPTSGSIKVRGRVAALLELGLGFHPDFTGRQNVYMAGQLLGLESRDIAKLMPSIEAFAEIGEYIDQPVRVYSSGMQVRLAFSIATAQRPDILIVDEALSVGDAYFQHKSFDRIRQFREQGTTLLLVSHDKNAILSICDRVALLDHGTIQHQGAPDQMMDLYNALIAEPNGEGVSQVESDMGVATQSGSGDATVAAIQLMDSSSLTPLNTIPVGTNVRLLIDVAAKEDLKQLVLGIAIKNRFGQTVFGTNTFYTNNLLTNVRRGAKLRYSFDFTMLLGAGIYSVTTALTEANTHLVNNFEWRDLAYHFEVVNLQPVFFEGWSWLNPSVAVTLVSRPDEAKQDIL